MTYCIFRSFFSKKKLYNCFVYFIIKIKYNLKSLTHIDFVLFLEKTKLKEIIALKKL